MNGRTALSQPAQPAWRRIAVRLPMLAAFLLFLGLAAYQLHLPGLHYDEVKEAGLNAMQLLLGQPVTAFRDATVGIGPWRVPLMVQDYIGALNVVLAVPFLAVGGVNVVALRWLPLIIAALTLVMVWLAARRLGGPLAAAAAALLLAVNPSFIFWSRQGIFVTNLTALLFMASLWTGLRWWQERRPRDLWLTAFLWGLGIYAKLLFVWAIGALVIVAAGAMLLTAGSRKLEVRSWRLEAGNWQPKAGKQTTSASAEQAEKQPRRHLFAGASASTSACACACFLLPLLPLILFNLRTGGTLASIFGNLGSSYYGVDNSAYLANLATRLDQIGTLLRGDHFWYLGETYANPWAAWLAAALIVLGLVGWILCRPVSVGRVFASEPKHPVLKIAARRLLEPSNMADGVQFSLVVASRPTWKTERNPALTLAGWSRRMRLLQRPLRILRLRRLPAFLLPLALLVLMVAQSAFTVSDLFITHYAILLPLIPLAAGLAFGAVWQACRGAEELRRGGVAEYPDRRPSASLLLRTSVAVLALLAVLAWAGIDAWTTIRYHRILAISGGYVAHSDASARLAAYLDEKGYTAPVVLDWGIEAPLRFLTAGRVNPIEVFGYARLDAPDAGFAERAGGWLGDSNTVYVGPPPDKAVFRGRVEAMAALAEQQGRLWLQEAWFHQRSGELLFVIYRSIPKG